MTSLLDSVFHWRFAAKAIAWGAAMVGVLQLQSLSGSWSHVICGPWGCGPPLEAVVTCHLVWVLLLAPLVMVFISRQTPAALRVVGAVAAAAGVAGLITVAIWVGAVWFPQTSSYQRPYVLHKYAYTLACLIDVPIVQLIVSGGILFAVGRKRAARGTVPTSEDVQ